MARGPFRPQTPWKAGWQSARSTPDVGRRITPAIVAVWAGGLLALVLLRLAFGEQATAVGAIGVLLVVLSTLRM